MTDPSPHPSEAERLLAIELRANHLKHMTTLGLTAAGGVVTLGGSIFAQAESRSDLWISAGIFTASALAAFLASNSLIESLRTGRNRRRSIDYSEAIASGLLGAGTGYFLFFAIDTLGGM